ncbi:MAG: CGGC domain-containing protein [Nitrospirota bacterium]
MAKKRIAVIACKNIKGISCVGGCLKCFKGMAEKAGEYERWKDYEIDVTGMDDCGGCPGLVIPKVALMAEDLKKKIESKFQKEVILGTHPY